MVVQNDIAASYTEEVHIPRFLAAKNLWGRSPAAVAEADEL
jgi:hypothetical protein